MKSLFQSIALLIAFSCSFSSSAFADLVVSFTGTLDDGLNTPFNFELVVNDIRGVDGNYQSTNFETDRWGISREQVSQTRIFLDALGSPFSGGLSVEDTPSEPSSRFGVRQSFDDPLDTSMSFSIGSDETGVGNGFSLNGNAIDDLAFSFDLDIVPLSDYADATFRPSDILPLGTFNVERNNSLIRFVDVGSNPNLGLNISTVRFGVTAVPEPSSGLLVAVACCSFVLGRRKTNSDFPCLMLLTNRKPLQNQSPNTIKPHCFQRRNW